MPTPEEIIEANLAKPKSGTVDGQSFSQFSAQEQIDMAQFISNKGVGKKKRKGIAMSKYVPGGAE